MDVLLEVDCRSRGSEEQRL